MKKINVLLTVCLVVGFAVFMAANASIASDSIMGKDMKIFGQGHGPGNGTGNGGSGPKDGTGNGSKQGTCTRLISDTSNEGILISRNGSGKGQGTGPHDGSGPRGGTPSCPSS
jgi:hypothetical protein